jgi:hypothetical protein
VLKDYPVDLIHLIRSIQRLEGNPDCFRSAIQNCGRVDCAWRIYCLKELQEYPDEKKETSDPHSGKYGSK